MNGKGVKRLRQEDLPEVIADLDTSVMTGKALSGRSPFSPLNVSMSASTLLSAHHKIFTEEEREVVKAALQECDDSSSFGAPLKRQNSRTAHDQSQELVLKAISICIVRETEEIACSLVPAVIGEFPLHLVHRAGELGQVKLLKALIDYQVPLRASKCLQRIPLKLLPAYKRQHCQLQLFSNSRFVTSNDVLRWACLSGDHNLVRYVLYREVLSFTLQFDTRLVVQQLLIGEFDDLLEEMFLKGKLPMDRLTLLAILDSPRPDIAQRLAQVHSTQTWTSGMSTSTPQILASKKVIWKLIDKLAELQATITAFYLLSFVHVEDFDKVAVERLHDSLQNVIESGSLESNLLVNHWNPLLVCVVASEQCEKISHKSLTYRDMFARQAGIFLDIAAHIQSQYCDYVKLKELYAEKLFGRKCVFDIIAGDPERYRPLLMNNEVVSIAEELWRGPIRAGFGLGVCCVPGYFFSLMKVPADCWRVHKLYKLRFRVPSYFQYRFWLRDGFIRYCLETICLISVFALMVDELINYLAEVEDGQSSEAVNDEDIFVLSYASTLVIYHIQIMVLKVFLKYPPIPDIRAVLDAGLLVFAVIVEDLQTGGALLDLNKDQSVYVLELTSGLLYLFAGFRIMIVLLRTRTFGPILRMIYVIWKDIMNYVFIYFLTICSFSLLFTSTLWRVDQFSSIQLTIRTLFHWGISGLDMENISSRPWLASILGMTWTLISAVFMLNLMIAVLSARYEQLAPQAKADYVCIVYQSYHQTRCDSDYGCLVIAPAPFNFLTLPAIPLYLLFPDKAKKINKVFSYISFQVMFGVAALCFALYCAVVSVFMYLAVPLLIVRRGGWRRSFWVLPWVLAGPVYLVYLCALSFRHFYQYIYFEEEEEASKEVDFYSKLTEHLRRLTERGGSTPIPFDEVTASFRQFPGTMLPLTRSNSRGSVSQRSSAKSGLSSGLAQSFAALQWKKIVKLLQPFASYDPTRSAAKVIEISRTYRFFKLFGGNPERLRAANVQYVQKAILRANEDK